MNLAYTTILGRPLIFYFGIMTITSVFLTALMGFLTYNKIKDVFKWHIFFAVTSLILASLHGLMGILTYL